MPDRSSHVVRGIFWVCQRPSPGVSVVDGPEVAVLGEGGAVGGARGHVAVERARKEFRGDVQSRP